MMRTTQGVFLLLFVLLAGAGPLSAQKKNYDVFSYVHPAGFRNIPGTGFLGLEKKEGRDYCQLFLYPLAAGSGTPQSDFEKAWDFFARKPAENVNDPETLRSDTVDGWTVISASARGQYNRQPYALMLNSFTRGPLQFFMAFVFTKESYGSTIENFVGSVEPDPARLKDREKLLTIHPPANASVSGSGRPSAMKISYPETRFGDGWVARAFFDYLQVVKSGTEVRIYFPNAGLDQSKEPLNGRPIESRYWDSYIAPYFTYPEILQREGTGRFGEAAIWEARVTEKSSGKNSYLGMLLDWENGNCTMYVVLAPDANSLHAQFGNQAAFTAMSAYNKFSATAADMVGTWSSYSGAAMSYYYTGTGLYAGTATAQISNKFVFRADGSYESEHAATTTYNTAPTHTKQQYKGRYSATPWSALITNRHPKDPGEFHCQLEAVRGGYILRLVNKKFTGNNMALVKIK